jgi:imidazolonepropionase-like amidohydrolase
MIRSLLSTCGALLLIAAQAHGQPRSAGPIVELRNAQWFDGRSFATGPRWMRDGRFIARPGQRADSVVDLRGRWMVPPYADAHTHGPDGARGMEEIRDMFLRLGVFYVQTLANSRTGAREIRARVNVPSSIDVQFANAAVTSTGGHPQQLYELLALYYRTVHETDAEKFAAFRSRLRDNDTYYRLDSLPQLPRILAEIARDSMPIVKVILVGSEEFDTKFRDSTFAGAYGLRPALLAPLVAGVQTLGKRVWAHVDTPHDFALAMRAGVDALAHVPGYGAAFETDAVARAMLLPDSLLRLARARPIPMTATLVLGALEAGTDTAKLRRFREVSVRNARALRAAGFTLLAGSDTYSSALHVRTDPQVTADELRLTPLERLRLLAVDTPRAIYPARRIAALRSGYEASALGLMCNPLRQVQCLTRIDQRLKQGSWLSVPADSTDR